MYISLKEYIRIIKYLKENNMLMEECIIRLMYDAGLRIGEVLGLTDEDLRETEEGFIVYIRNRVSDAKDQNAKTCMKVFATSQYKTQEYNTIMSGFQMVPISEELFSLIDEYCDSDRRNAAIKHKSNFNESAKADKITEDEGENTYLFINRLGRPLTQALWNITLRKIFNACKIPVDTGKRDHNLNHRFRHGAAMYRVQYLHMDVLDLAVFLRHRNVASTLKYYRPTISDQIALKEMYGEILYKHIPAIDPYEGKV